MGKKKGPVRDAELARRWRGVVGDWRRSGLGVRAFCRKRKVAESGFYYWRRELDRRKADLKRRRGKPGPLFVPVTVTEEVRAGCIEVRLPSGVELRAPSGVDADRLARLASALSGFTAEAEADRPC